MSLVVPWPFPRNTVDECNNAGYNYLESAPIFSLLFTILVSQKVTMHLGLHVV